MHKRVVNTASIEMVISPAGPILIKSGKEGGDPAKPDMEFVETYYGKGKTIYLPGSSLKGALRAHCERIVRTVGSASKNGGGVWACDPLSSKSDCRRRNDKADETYSQSCTICRLFGSTEMSSHFRIKDAYPDEPITIEQTEERNGVAIDRVFGSVAVGPFNYQVVTRGEFKTAVHLKNFTTAQLGLLALAIRDFDNQRVGLGFAKSRGMGNVFMRVGKITFHYPGVVKGERAIESLSGKELGATSEVLGAGCFASDDKYGYRADDRVAAAVTTGEDDYGYGVVQSLEGDDEIRNLWRECVRSWKREAQGGR
jgi:CRISPR-associated RAMP protein (TIGR02581 family)